MSCLIYSTGNQFCYVAAEDATCEAAHGRRVVVEEGVGEEAAEDGEGGRFVEGGGEKKNTWRA